MIFVRSLLFVVASTCALWISLFFSEKAYKDDRTKQLLACGVLFPIFASVSIFIPALFGVLYFFVPSIILCILCVFIVFFVKKETHPEISAINNESNRYFQASVFSLLLLFSFVFGLLFGKLVYRGTYFGGDDLSYHPAFIIGLITQHDLSLWSIAYSAHYPFNAELYASTYVLPFCRDGLAGLAGFYWLGLLFIIFLYWGHIWSFTRWTAVFGLSIILLTPEIQRGVATYTAVDMAASVMMLASAAFILPGSEQTGTRRTDFVFSGLCAGFAVGCKVTMIFLAGCLVFAVFWNQRKQNWKRSYYFAGMLLLTIFLFGGFSYVRNLLLTGNPLFPASFGPLEGPFGKEQQNATKLLFWILKDPMNGDHWKVILNGYVNWPISFFLLSLTGYCMAIKTCFAKGDYDEELLFVKRLVFWMGLLLVVLYPVIPFSGSPNSPDATLALSRRYVLFSYLVGILLFLTEIQKSERIKYVYMVIFLALSVRFGLRFSKITIAVIVLCSSWVIITLCAKYGESIQKGVLPKKIMVIPAAGFLFGVLVFLPEHQKLTDQRVFYYEGDKMAGVLETMEKLFPDEARLCLFGINYHSYPFWGRQFQFRPVAVDVNGQVRDKFYRVWENHPEEAIFWSNKKAKFTPAVLVNNLIKSKADYVITSKLLTGEWPEQQQILQADKRVRKIYEDATNCTWEIDKKPTDSDTPL